MMSLTLVRPPHLYRHLSRCFNHSLRIERHLTRYKHWFQHPNPNQTIHRLRRNTLVIAQFRNPYDWLEAMRIHPHHSPEHLHLEWQEFLQRPWTMERIGLDLNITSNTTRCKEGFRYNEIVSCHVMPLPLEAYENIHCSRHQPYYELKQDGSGMPFANVMEMRAAKIHNFLQTVNYPRVVNVWPLQYEELLAGTENMLNQISEITGIPYVCDPFPVQQRKTRELSKEFVEYVSEHVDWSAEELIGYQRRRN